MELRRNQNTFCTKPHSCYAINKLNRTKQLTNAAKQVCRNNCKTIQDICTLTHLMKLNISIYNKVMKKKPFLTAGVTLDMWRSHIVPFTFKFFYFNVKRSRVAAELCTCSCRSRFHHFLLDKLVHQLLKCPHYKHFTFPSFCEQQTEESQ